MIEGNRGLMIKTSMVFGAPSLVVYTGRNWGGDSNEEELHVMGEKSK